MTVHVSINPSQDTLYPHHVVLYSDITPTKPNPQPPNQASHSTVEQPKPTQEPTNVDKEKKKKKKKPTAEPTPTLMPQYILEMQVVPPARPNATAARGPYGAGQCLDESRNLTRARNQDVSLGLPQPRSHRV